MGHEALIKSMVAGSLRWDENEERPIDRVAAIGMVIRYNEIGGAMLRVESLDASELRKVIFLIVRKLNHKYKITRGFAQRIAFAVLHEYYRPNCVFCGGKGEIHKHATATENCPYCNGTGLHHYTDSDRLSLVGGTYNKAAYDGAMVYIRDGLANMISDASKRLV